MTPDTWQNRIVDAGAERPDQLLANPANWRVHPKIQQSRLAAVLDRVGWVQRVIVNRRSGHIVDGHLRVKLAEERGEAEIPVSYVDLEPEEEALILATLDPLGALAGSDNEQLQSLVSGIDAGDDDRLIEFLLELEGVDPHTVEAEGNTDPDEIPPPPAAPITQPGDVWILGDHVLHVGDATEPSAYRAVLRTRDEPERPDAMWTDPPYNVAYTDSRGRVIQNDQQTDANFVKFLRSAFTAAFQSMAPGAAVYIAHADSEGEAFRRAMREAGVDVRQCLIWVKDGFTIGRQDYQWKHEPILYGWTEGTHHWYADRSQGTVVDDDTPLDKLSKAELLERVKTLINSIETSVHREAKPKRNAEHPTMKPVALINRHLKNSTRRGDLVLDPFGGSGSTLIACEQLGRKARTIELDPMYADVIITRWQRFTDLTASRADGLSWHDAATG